MFLVMKMDCEQWLFILLLFLMPLTSTSLCQICHCSEDVINCRDKGLSSVDIPSDFDASNWVELHLAHNKLTEVPNLSRFTALEKLDLSHNRITRIPNDVFSAQTALRELDLSMNTNFSLSDIDLPHAAFSGLAALQILKLKQATGPAKGFDYRVISSLNTTLRELYIIGVQNLSTSLSALSKLHTLSLGGDHCSIPSMMSPYLEPITNLPLKRLSARFCKISEISRGFLMHFTNTLERLDLSYNPLKIYLSEIFHGISQSNVNVLLLDQINVELPADSSSMDSCPWHLSGEWFSLLNTTTKLEVISLRANQISDHSQIELRKCCLQLLYLDLSQNLLHNISDLDIELNKGYKKLNTPSLRYLGLSENNRRTPCPSYQTRLINYSEDSYLFLDEQESFFWNLNQNNNIAEPQALLSIGTELYIRKDTLCGIFGCLLLSGVQTVFRDLAEERRSKGSYAPSDSSLDTAVSWLWARASIINFEAFLSSLTYLPPNMTTFTATYDYKSVLTDCSWNFFLNNLASVDLSGSSFGEIHCNDISGLPYLSNLTCNKCNITGWNREIFTGLDIRNLSLASNRLGTRFKHDTNGSLLQGLPNLISLNIANQIDGLRSHDHLSFLKNNERLKYLYIQGNQISTWNATLTPIVPELLILDMSGNNISYLEASHRNDLSELHTRTGLQVFMAGNGVYCEGGEASIDYIRWLLNSSVIADAHHMYCAESNISIEYFINPTTTLKATQGMNPTPATTPGTTQGTRSQQHITVHSRQTTSNGCDNLFGFTFLFMINLPLFAFMLM